MQRKRLLTHVRALTWGIEGDRDFLEYLAGQLNGIDAHRRRWLHFTGRQPDPVLQAREHFGSRARAAQQAAQTYAALSAVRAILAPSVPLLPAPAPLHDETIRRFSRLEQLHPAHLALVHMALLVGGPEPAEITKTSHSEGHPCGHAVFTVWMFLGLRERDRLKRCLHCRGWFVDRMKSKRMVWCSTPCHDAVWTRERRRASAAARQSPATSASIRADVRARFHKVVKRASRRRPR
jgi:hypothetical protein